MSAYVCDDGHISALAAYVALAVRQVMYNGRVIDVSDQVEVAQILFAENVRSVCARYSGDTPDMYIFTFDDRHAKQATHGGYSAVQILKACNCYGYQACESTDWEQTLAHKIIAWAKEHAIGTLPGYEAAAWGID